MFWDVFVLICIMDEKYSASMHTDAPFILMILLQKVCGFIKIQITRKKNFFKSHGFIGCISSKAPACQCRRWKGCRFDPWVRKIPWRKAWQPIPVFLPGESHGQRSLVGYSPWGHKESDKLTHTSSITLRPSKERAPVTYMEDTHWSVW